MPSPSPWPRLLAIALLVGGLDLLFAWSFWYWKVGAPFGRVCQSIAAGLLGPRSFAGGLATELLGAALHFAIILAMFLVARELARRLPALARHSWRYGAIYGLGLYVAMNHVIVPLSAAAPPAKDALWIVLSVIVHMLIGMACLWAAAKSLPRSD